MAKDKLNNEVELLFHVQGGGDISGASGKKILSEISSILRAVEKDPKSQIKVSVDKAYLKEQVEKALKTINVTAGSKSSKGTKSGSSANRRATSSTRPISPYTQARIDNLNKTSAEKTRKAAAEANMAERIASERVRKETANADKAALSLKNAQDKAAESASKAAISKDASMQNYKVSARRYYDKYSSKISANPELQQAYNELANGNFRNVEEAKKKLADFKTACYEAGVETKDFGSKVKELWENFGKSLLTGIAIDAVRRAMSDAIQTVKELDEAVVNLSMVTGYGRRQTQNLLETYVDLGKKLGATTTEVASAANEWLRQGYSLQETNELIEASVVLSKVGMLESADATQYLTSALKGYQVSISDVMDIADKLTSVDMEAAVSTAGLAEAMSKTANSARLAGVNMNRLLGYIAAVGEVTQDDMGSVGTTFKTVFSRLSNIKLGRLEDENGEDITQSLNDAETVLNRVNIRLRDTATSYRDMGDVFDEIAGKWDDFNDVERNTIAMAFGGTRQKEQVLTLFENYGNALKYAETAANSSGTAMQKYEAYTSGLEKSLKSFQAAWESLVNHVVNSDFLKGIVDLGTGILNIADGLAKTKALLPAIIASVATLNNVGERMIENAGLCTLRKCA